MKRRQKRKLKGEKIANLYKKKKVIYILNPLPNRLTLALQVKPGMGKKEEVKSNSLSKKKEDQIKNNR